MSLKDRIIKFVDWTCNGILAFMLIYFLMDLGGF